MGNSRSKSSKTEPTNPNSSSTTSKEKPSKKKKTQQKIIDEFIDKNPEITRNVSKTSQTKTEDLSFKSGIENTELISENLAKINLKQGNKSKAIKIYELLKLKYPEKKAYFTAEIKKIK